MKNKTFYGIREFSIDGTLVAKEGTKVKIIKDTGKSYFYKQGNSEGYLSHELFNKVFAPFRVNEVVFHKFYGIGQIVLSHKETVNLAVVFFCNPNKQYQLDEKEMKVKDVKR